ncbi:acyl-homoserine-lactone synthase [Oceanicoccus sp. KOV_DT_Chl]|uniref:acyl-homoserine-lactone synthase n=1 Tax=Oceanicoccus sp. KOV_DT_Chl TaxID=1904639 RepID=UPI00190E7A67|nr:acyl-homoserine-lactone synthase [Oceanicoccus sp. KOV_DT_Chl]
MLNFIEGRSKHLSDHLKDTMYHYRYQVFVERLGWELDTAHNREVDEFDHDGTRYLIAQDKHEDIIGFARMLPTTQPYLLEHIFPELLNGMPPPKENTVWELSRFTSMDLKKTHPSHTGQFSSETTKTILMKTLFFAYQNGAKHLISVSPVGIERLLKNVGIQVHRAGPPLTINGHRLIACWINIKENLALYSKCVDDSDVILMFSAGAT